MNNDKEQWIKEVVNSMKDSQRAQPRADLLSDIQARMEDSESRAIPMRIWRNYAAAAAIVLLLNATALFVHKRSMHSSPNEAKTAALYTESLSATFQIYD